MDTPGDLELERRTTALLDALKTARAALSKQEVVYFGPKGTTPGLLLQNYANMILNRNIDLYDDCMLLFDAGRYASACLIARCVMETHATGLYAWDKVQKAFNKEGAEAAGKKILAFINSSRFKAEEQKSFKAGKFELSDFHFTDQAKTRILTEAAAVEHVANALRFLYSLEMESSGLKESAFELTYNALSEWAHPSQTSLFQQYAAEIQRVETSWGFVSLQARARHQCVEGLKLIQYSQNLHRDMIAFGRELHEQCEG